MLLGKNNRDRLKLQCPLTAKTPGICLPSITPLPLKVLPLPIMATWVGDQVFNTQAFGKNSPDTRITVVPFIKSDSLGGMCGHEASSHWR